MTCPEYATTVELHKRDSLALPDIEGTTLRVTRGMVWITQEDDTRDVVLRGGDMWVVERSGLTIIEAQNDATICAAGPRFRHRLRGAAPPVRRAGGFWRRVRERAAEWYSLTPRRPIPHV
jgi:hypothetical protein